MSKFLFRTQAKTLSQLQTQFVAKSFGVTFHFNIQTFTDSETPSPPPSINTFNPSALNVDQWLTSAVAAKAAYAELTTKHIDGFCLWPTATTTYNVTNTTWYASNGHVDIVRLFVDKCRQYGIAPALYFCARDYKFEADHPGFTQASYLSYTETQLRELLSNYGDILDIKLDADNIAGGGFASLGYPWANGGAACDFIRSVQTQTVCANNIQSSLPPPLTDTNIPVYEDATFPGQSPDVSNTVPAEWWDTIYDSQTWFWKSTSPALQTSSTLISNIATANARTSNYNLNVPPDTTGAIESRMVTVMQAIGAR
jgi:alpha-L-fucosidase